MILLSTELVHAEKGEIYTTSVKVAEYLEVPHKFLVKTIDKLVKKIESKGGLPTPTFSQKFIETTTINKQKREYRTYDMNEPAFQKLVMNLWQYKKAFEVQDIFVQAFFHMRNILQQHTNTSWVETREAWKIQRIAETDKIKEFVEYAKAQGSTQANYYYANITKMTYRALELLNHDRPIREILSRIGLTYLAVAEDQVIMNLEKGMKEWLHYKEIYAMTKVNLEKFCDFLPEQTKMIT